MYWLRGSGSTPPPPTSCHHTPSALLSHQAKLVLSHVGMSSHHRWWGSKSLPEHRAVSGLVNFMNSRVLL